MRSSAAGGGRGGRADDAVRVIVLDHTGRVFCSGMDLSEAAGGGAQDQGVREFPEPAAGDLGLHPSRWSPVVRHRAGRRGGADRRVRRRRRGDLATFAFSEVRLGVMPAVISAVVLPRMVPQRRTG